MTINARYIHNPRTRKSCDQCGQRILFGFIRLFGMADRCDKPRAIHFHPECMEHMKLNDQEKAAIEKWRIKTGQ